jgi:hypothetical protein
MAKPRSASTSIEPIAAFWSNPATMFDATGSAESASTSIEAAVEEKSPKCSPNPLGMMIAAAVFPPRIASAASCASLIGLSEILNDDSLRIAAAIRLLTSLSSRSSSAADTRGVDCLPLPPPMIDTKIVKNAIGSAKQSASSTGERRSSRYEIRRIVPIILEDPFRSGAGRRPAGSGVALRRRGRRRSTLRAGSAARANRRTDSSVARSSRRGPDRS